jgi:hypothetical protein
MTMSCLMCRRTQPGTTATPSSKATMKDNLAAGAGRAQPTKTILQELRT